MGAIKNEPGIDGGDHKDGHRGSGLCSRILFGCEIAMESLTSLVTKKC